jgi:hypothetical protein
VCTKLQYGNLLRLESWQVAIKSIGKETVHIKVHQNDLINNIAYNKQYLLKLAALINAKDLFFTTNTTKINLQDYVKESVTNSAQFWTCLTNCS